MRTWYRLTTSGGDEQDFSDLHAVLVEAGKYLDPEKLGASSVTITVDEDGQ